MANDFLQRKNRRLPGYDYSQDGYYFITICTHNRQPVFGKIVDRRMALNEYGKIVHNEWVRSANLRKEIKIDKFVIMPNHFHAILGIDHSSVESYGHTTGASTSGSGTRTYIHTSLQSPSRTLGAIIRGFKASVTTKINTFRNTPQNPIWQSGFHDHIIRNETEYRKIWEYIDTNPLKWQEDCYYEN